MKASLIHLFVRVLIVGLFCEITEVNLQKRKVMDEWQGLVLLFVNLEYTN